VADSCVGEGVGCLALDVGGEARGGVLGDGALVGQVAAAAFCAVGEQGQGGGFAGTGAGLQSEVVAGLEGVGSGHLLVGRLHGVFLKSGGRALGAPSVGGAQDGLERDAAGDRRFVVRAGSGR